METSAFSVSRSDIIFVNVTAVGRQVMTATMSGSASVDELIDNLRGQLAGHEGLLTINLRNRTQGTITKRVLRLQRPTSGLLRAQMKGYAA